MIEVKALIVTDTVLHDRSTNTMSIINIHEQFRPAGYPQLVPRFTVFSMLQREPDDAAAVECTLRIRLNGESIFEREVGAEFGDGMLTRVVMRFEGFVIREAGTITVAIATPDTEFTSYGIPAFPAEGQPVPEPLPAGDAT